MARNLASGENAEADRNPIAPKGVYYVPTVPNLALGRPVTWTSFPV